jgi:hypothetical protein
MRPEDAKHHPMISVVIPTYNSGEFILRTLSSVLAQTYRDFEIVVSDDGSTDGTLDAVRTFLGGFPGISWRLVENSHGGPGAARNAGILAASGEWVAFLDSDDVWFPEKLSCVVAFIGLHPEARGSLPSLPQGKSGPLPGTVPPKHSGDLGGKREEVPSPPRWSVRPVAAKQSGLRPLAASE